MYVNDSNISEDDSDGQYRLLRSLGGSIMKPIEAAKDFAIAINLMEKMLR